MCSGSCTVRDHAMLIFKPRRLYVIIVLKGTAVRAPNVPRKMFQRGSFFYLNVTYLLVFRKAYYDSSKWRHFLNFKFLPKQPKTDQSYNLSVLIRQDSVLNRWNRGMKVEYAKTLNSKKNSKTTLGTGFPKQGEMLTALIDQGER